MADDPVRFATERSPVHIVGALLLGMGSGLLIGAIWAAAGALWRGTSNGPAGSYYRQTAPYFDDLRLRVNGTVIVVSAVVVIVVVACWAFTDLVRPSLVIRVATIAGLFALLVAGRFAGLRGEWLSDDALGSGLPATITGWYLAAAGVATILFAALLCPRWPGGAGLRVSGVVVAALVAVTAVVRAGVPTTYDDAVTVVIGDQHEVTAPAPARVATTPVVVPGARGAVAWAIGPGFVAFSSARGIVMYNGDDLTERWRLEIADRMYRGVVVQPFLAAGVVAVALERPDGTYETRGVGAYTGEQKWTRLGRWWVSSFENRHAEPKPGHHLLSMNDDENEVRAASPQTGADLWLKGASPVADRFRATLEGVPVARHDSALVLVDRQTGREVLRADRLSISCNEQAECLWANADGKAVLTSLTGSFDDVVFDRDFYQGDETGPAVILADQVIWFARHIDDQPGSGLVVGDRATGRTTEVLGLVAPQAMPGGVVTQSELAGAGIVLRGVG